MSWGYGGTERLPSCNNPAVAAKKPCAVKAPGEGFQLRLPASRRSSSGGPMLPLGRPNCLFCRARSARNTITLSRCLPREQKLVGSALLSCPAPSVW